VDNTTAVTVRLTVDDGHGHTDDDTATVTIQPAAAPLVERPYVFYAGIIILIVIIIGLLACFVTK
jgi:hypothetical protein